MDFATINKIYPMGVCNTEKKINLIGLKNHRLFVLYITTITNNSKQPHYACLCDCGKCFLVSRANLANLKTKSCGCLQKETVQKLGWSNKKDKQECDYNKIFYTYQRAAIKRNLIFELTKEYFIKLINSNCEYCGQQPEIKSGHNNIKFLANGVDRIDNKKGYTMDNVRTACSMCNRSKSNKTEEYFLLWARKLVEFQDKGKVKLTL